jgi:hypothetical protein
MSNLKLNLEWIPDAYALQENATLKKDVAANYSSKYHIVKSTSLYDAKKSSKHKKSSR